MQYDLSLLLPGIRTNHWVKTYETAKQSCGKYNWEIIIAGPFFPPPELNLPNVKFIKTFSCPSTACQMAATLAEGDLILNIPDDAIFTDRGFEMSVDLFNAVREYKTIVNVRITEGHNYGGGHLPDHYWSVNNHPTLRQPGIPRNYRVSLGHMMDAKYFKEMGGFDCGYEYPNFNSHDLMFRCQYDGCKIYDSPTDVMLCNWYTNRAVDHGAIEDAYEDDLRRFTTKYADPNALNPDTVRIPFDNWKQYSDPWKRRFSSKLHESYEEMLKDV